MAQTSDETPNFFRMTLSAASSSYERNLFLTVLASMFIFSFSFPSDIQVSTLLKSTIQTPSLGDEGSI